MAAFPPFPARVAAQLAVATGVTVRAATAVEQATVATTPDDIEIRVRAEYSSMLKGADQPYPQTNTYLLAVVGAQTKLPGLMPGSVVWLAYFPELDVECPSPVLANGRPAEGATISRGFVLLSGEGEWLTASWTNQK